MAPCSVRPPIFSAPCTALPSLVPRPCYSLVPMAAPVGSPSSSARVAPAPRLIHGRAPSVQLVEAPLPAASSCSSSPSALAPDFCAQLLSHGRVARSGVHRVQPACAPLAGQPQLSIAAHSFFPNRALPSVLLCSPAHFFPAGVRALWSPVLPGRMPSPLQCRAPNHSSTAPSRELAELYPLP